MLQIYSFLFLQSTIYDHYYEILKDLLLPIHTFQSSGTWLHIG